jgi:uncharacterized membrane protein
MTLVNKQLQKISKLWSVLSLSLWMLPVKVLGADLTDPVSLNNPLKVDTIQDLLVAILNIVMVLMVPIIVFYIIYSGFKYVMARGNASQVEEASQSLLYAVIGGVLILGAFALANIIQSIVTAFQAAP